MEEILRKEISLGESSRIGLFGGSFNPAHEWHFQVAKHACEILKLDKIKYNSNEEAKADAIRKMVIAMSKDIRVLILKLADRLHNIETIEYHKDWKQEKIASETLYVLSLIHI